MPEKFTTSFQLKNIFLKKSKHYNYKFGIVFYQLIKRLMEIIKK